jgi:hypothetical protein
MYKLCSSFIYKNAVMSKRNRMTTLSCIDNFKIKGLENFDAIIVDCASLYSRKQIDKIYNFFKHNVYQDSQPIFLFLE